MAGHVRKLSHLIPCIEKRIEKHGYKVQNHDFISISNKIMPFIGINTVNTAENAKIAEFSRNTARTTF